MAEVPRRRFGVGAVRLAEVLQHEAAAAQLADEPLPPVEVFGRPALAVEPVDPAQKIREKLGEASREIADPRLGEGVSCGGKWGCSRRG